MKVTEETGDGDEMTARSYPRSSPKRWVSDSRAAGASAALGEVRCVVVCGQCV